MVLISHTTLSDEDIRSDLLLDIDVTDVLSATGYAVTRANKDCTPDRSSYRKRLVEVCKDVYVVIFNGRIVNEMRIE